MFRLPRLILENGISKNSPLIKFNLKPLYKIPYFRFHQLSKYTTLLIFMGGWISAAYCQPTYTDERTGVVVSFVGDEDMFPPEWIDDFDPHAVSLSRFDYERTQTIIATALGKYPVYIIKRNLKKVYVLNNLSFEGVGYGGTYSNNVLYIVNGGLEMGYDDLFVEQTFHHEFSSILFNNYVAAFANNETAWTQCNGSELGYGDGGFEALKSGESDMEFDDELNEQGFLHEYGRSDKENDFNAFAENIFAPSPEFWYLVKKYPRLKCKVDLMLTLYHLLDPIFTEEYFKSFDVND
jgi:hypothetical protein